MEQYNKEKGQGLMTKLALKTSKKKEWRESNGSSLLLSREKGKPGLKGSLFKCKPKSKSRRQLIALILRLRAF